MADSTSAISSLEIIRISSYYTIFGDFEKDVWIYKLTKKYRVKIKEKHSIIESWLLRVTEKTTKEEFEIRYAIIYTGYKRYIEFERV